MRDIPLKVWIGGTLMVGVVVASVLAILSGDEDVMMGVTSINWGIALCCLIFSPRGR